MGGWAHGRHCSHREGENGCDVGTDRRIDGPTDRQTNLPPCEDDVQGGEAGQGCRGEGSSWLAGSVPAIWGCYQGVIVV